MHLIAANEKTKIKIAGHLIGLDIIILTQQIRSKNKVLNSDQFEYSKFDK